MVVEIDGSILEGGGQILRISVALSVLQCLPIRIKNIRAGRKKGGLAAQHLKGIHLARDLCQAKLDGDVLSSTEVTFKPHKITSGTFLADIQTAGSIALLLQVSLPCVLFGNERSFLSLKGGTNAEMAPQIDYIVNVFKPNLKKFGADFDCNIIKRGFYPAGGGIVKIMVDPVAELKPLELVDFGEIKEIRGEAFVAGVLPIKMAQEMAEAAKDFLEKSLDVSVRMSIKARKLDGDEAFGNGSGLTLVAETTTGCYLGGSHLGKRGIRNEEVGRKAAEELLGSLRSKVCFDEHSQDQMIIFMALANGKSRIKVGPITLHTKTAIYVSELLTKTKFNIIDLNDGSNIIECQGIALKNKNIE